LINRELILVVDFGGQYNQLIARRVRENHVYCEIVPYTISATRVKEMSPKGIIFTGGPNSVYGENSPKIDNEIFNLNIPILGICYGAQLMAHTLGGNVKTATVREYGKTVVNLDTNNPLFDGIVDKQCWMSHTDFIEAQPGDFKISFKL